MSCQRTGVARSRLPILSACLLLAGCGSRDQPQFPNDLEIVAQIFPGKSDWKPWKHTITADGKVVREFANEERESQLTRADLKDLLDKNEEADFFALKERYDSRVIDSSTLVLKITRNKKTHEVEVDAPAFQKKDEDVRKFLKIWTEILRKVPAPNAEQKPEDYMS
ncbi:MAG: hypothetical protein ACLQGP_37260 [Isosphaeraceae bacterium]